MSELNECRCRGLFFIICSLCWQLGTAKVVLRRWQSKNVEIKFPFRRLYILLLFLLLFCILLRQGLQSTLLQVGNHLKRNSLKVESKASVS